LAAELAPRNITVNTLHPGPVVTDMTAAILEDPTKQEFIDELVNQSLLKVTT
jgi:NAD(P)-dependent dehydrogenase (short-subunit alcohol dehydrogenase family)